MPGLVDRGLDYGIAHTRALDDGRHFDSPDTSAHQEQARTLLKLARSQCRKGSRQYGQRMRRATDLTCESTRILSIRTHFLRIRTRIEILSIPLTRELAWFPPRKGRFGPKAFRWHRALRGAGFPAPG